MAGAITFSVELRGDGVIRHPSRLQRLEPLPQGVEVAEVLIAGDRSGDPVLGNGTGLPVEL